MNYFPTILLLVIIVFVSYFISVANGQPTTMLFYLKDGEDMNNLKIYTVDYVDAYGSKLKTTENSKSVIVSDSQVITDITMKVPDDTGYSLTPIKETMSISHVQPISDKLNKYELKEPVDLGNPIILTEISPTTAVMNYTIDFFDMLAN